MKKLRLLFILLFTFAFTSCGASEIEKKFQNDHSAYLQRAAEFKEIVSTINLSVELYENEKLIESEEVDMLIKLEQDPLYMEIYGDGNDLNSLTIYYVDVTNRVFSQNVKNGSFGNSTFVAAIDEFDPNSTGNASPSTAFNFSHIKTSLYNTTYHLEGNAYYMFSKDYLKQIAEMYGYEEDDIKSLKGIDVNLSMEFFEQSMKMTYVMSATTIFNYKSYDLKVTMKYTEGGCDFDRYKSKPSSGGSSGGTTVTDKFSSASHVSVGQTINLDRSNKMYYTALKEGSYAFEYIPSDGEQFDNFYRFAHKVGYLSYTIYDSNKTVLKDINIGGGNYLTNTFIIEKTETYFIECRADDSMKYKLIKLEYSNSFKDENIIEYGAEVQGKTEGLYNIKKYVINSDVDGFVRITNTGDVFSIFTMQSYEQNHIRDYEVTDYFDKYIQKGENVFYVISTDTDIYFERDYSFTVSLLYEYDPDKYDLEYENLPILTETPTEEDYFLFTLFNPIGFQFEIKEAGEYVIKGVNSFYDYNNTIINEATGEEINGNYIDWEMVFSLEPGKYRINFYSNSTITYNIINPYYEKK